MSIARNGNMLALYPFDTMLTEVSEKWQSLYLSSWREEIDEFTKAKDLIKT